MLLHSPMAPSLLGQEARFPGNDGRKNEEDDQPEQRSVNLFWKEEEAEEARKESKESREEADGGSAERDAGYPNLVQTIIL